VDDAGDGPGAAVVGALRAAGEQAVVLAPAAGDVRGGADVGGGAEGAARGMRVEEVAAVEGGDGISVGYVLGHDGHELRRSIIDVYEV
jgi:hypothetical protein